MKKTHSLLLAAMLIMMTFTGCRSKSNDNMTPSTTTAPTTMPTTQATTQPTTASNDPTVASGNGPIDDADSGSGADSSSGGEMTGGTGEG